MRVKIQGGTLDSKENLCGGCKYALIMKGHKQSEQQRYCNRLDRPVQIGFIVAECTEFRKREEPELKRMEDTAWIVRTNNSGQAIGFISNKQFRNDNPDADVVPWSNR